MTREKGKPRGNGASESDAMGDASDGRVVQANASTQAAQGSAWRPGAGCVEGVGGNPSPLTAGFRVSDWNLRPLIDRLSFTVHLRDEKDFIKWVVRSVAVGERYNSRTPTYRYRWQLLDGITLELGNRASGACKSGIMLRLDYNPQKHDLAAVEGLAPFLMGDWNVTRVDVAIDYPHDLAAGLIRHDTMRKGATFHGSDGRLETVYIGAPTSGKMFRIYDKKREREHKGEVMPDGNLWRVEVEHRCGGSQPFPENLFDGLSIGYLGSIESLAWSTRQILAHIVQNPAVMKEAPKATRKRYKELLTKHSLQLDPDPVELYRRHRAALIAEGYRIMHTARGGAASYVVSAG